MEEEEEGKGEVRGREGDSSKESTTTREGGHLYLFSRVYTVPKLGRKRGYHAGRNYMGFEELTAWRYFNRYKPSQAGCKSFQ